MPIVAIISSGPYMAGGDARAAVEYLMTAGMSFQHPPFWPSGYDAGLGCGGSGVVLASAIKLYSIY